MKRKAIIVDMSAPNMKKGFPRRLEIESRIEHIEEAAFFVEKAARDLRFPESDIDDIAIALTEAVSNAMIHGNKDDATKKVIVEIIDEEDAIRILVKDEGSGFDPDALDNPLSPENLLRENGRGVFILKSLMDEVKYSSDETGTTATLIKYKSWVK